MVNAKSSVEENSGGIIPKCYFKILMHDTSCHKKRLVFNFKKYIIIYILAVLCLKRHFPNTNYIIQFCYRPIRAKIVNAFDQGKCQHKKAFTNFPRKSGIKQAKIRRIQIHSALFKKKVVCLFAASFLTPCNIPSVSHLQSIDNHRPDHKLT